MSGSGQGLASFLEQHPERVISAWLKRVEAMLGGSDLTRAELRDHVPAFLRALADALAPGESPDSVVDRPGSAHGAQRFRAGFDLREVVAEYALLSDVILELAHADGLPISVAEMRELSAAVNRGVAEAVAAYADERQESERRQAARHVAFISHELRNPLGGALLSLELMERTRLDESQRRSAAIVHRNLDRLRTLIDQVLTAERLAAGPELQREKLSFASLVERVAEEAALAALDRNVQLTVDVPPDTEIIADLRLLESVLSNLLQNAIKFSRAEGRVQLRARGDPDGLMVEIEDSCGGLEVPAEKLFRPFVQGGNEPDQRGFGLGLAIVRQAVEAHGGEIQVKSEPGRGCTFTFTIPTAPPPERNPDRA
jgi:signal transduction histidine kinase